MAMEREDANDTFTYQEEYIRSSGGKKLFTCQWLPGSVEPKALIFLCHGYAVECSVAMKGAAMRLAEAGYAVHGMDYEGHGKSDGLRGYVDSFQGLVADCQAFFKSVCEREGNGKRERYLFGESMGGAVALTLHRKDPSYWHGAVLVAPMCKIADDMKPSPLVTTVLTKLTNLIPTWKIVPVKDIIDLAIKRPEKRKELRSNPYCYTGRTRLKTAHELLKASLEVEKNLSEVSLPFLIVHGGDDKVTDPSVSKLLYESARSEDKSFELYPGMWHALIFGEPQENIDRVFGDIIAWLDQRTDGAARRSELELKRQDDDEKILLH